jgi:hypothetical protein
MASTAAITMRSSAASTCFTTRPRAASTYHVLRPRARRDGAVRASPLGELFRPGNLVNHTRGLAKDQQKG